MMCAGTANSSDVQTDNGCYCSATYSICEVLGASYGGGLVM